MGWDFIDVKRLSALALLPLFAAPMPVAFAQTGISQCVLIETDVERLACYDGLFRDNAAAQSGLSVTLQSETLIPARPSGRAPATMTVTCDADVLSVAFAFAGNTMSALGRDAGITLQYDLRAARSQTLPVNTDNTAIVLDNSRDAAAFLDGLAGATNLTARVTPVNSRSLSVRFRVDAFIAEVVPVRAACGI
ncbi:MAG: hypothetical protein ACI9GK_000825 [Devosia sp.]|jgi:hypothetical protein|tara:strand:+ start:4114 stop:4692 length:579 start_codon:yes stop_codon:yes gene_type:complete